MANSSDEEEEEESPEEQEQDEEENEDEEHDSSDGEGRPGLFMAPESNRAGVQTPDPLNQKNLLDDLAGNVSDEDSGSWEEELGYGTQQKANASGGEEEGEWEYGGEDEYGAEQSVRESTVVIDAISPKSKKKASKIVFNLGYTVYDVIGKVAKKYLDMRLKEIEEDHEGRVIKGEGNQKLSPCWDISWHDGGVTADFLSKMLPYQKINHYPGMYVVTRKNHLARNLMRMKKVFPDEYNFFPQTWLLPYDSTDFRNQFQSKDSGPQNYQRNKAKKAREKAKRDGTEEKQTAEQIKQEEDAKHEQVKPKPTGRTTFIVKPNDLSQGKGIFLSRKLEVIEAACKEEGMVVQEYLSRPHLVDELKYDLRIYVLVYGVNPLRVYMHKYGIVRFCTESYQKPTNYNLKNLFMHLTNYAINKDNDCFEENQGEDGEDEGHKRSLRAILEILAAEGANVQVLMRQIKDIIVKTMITSQPYLSHLYRSCQPEDVDNSMCFQILGFDILIDKKYRPWLIEVNQSPSFETASPLDYKVKKAVLQDAFHMLNASAKKRREWTEKAKKKMQMRILTGKQPKMDPEKKEALRQKKLDERFKFEADRLGGYEMIYPCKDEDRNTTYEGFIKKQQELWDEFTTGGKGGQKAKDAKAAAPQFNTRAGAAGNAPLPKKQTVPTVQINVKSKVDSNLYNSPQVNEGIMMEVQSMTKEQMLEAKNASINKNRGGVMGGPFQNRQPLKVSKVSTMMAAPPMVEGETDQIPGYYYSRSSTNQKVPMTGAFGAHIVLDQNQVVQMPNDNMLMVPQSLQKTLKDARNSIDFQIQQQKAQCNHTPKTGTDKKTTSHTNGFNLQRQIEYSSSHNVTNATNNQKPVQFVSQLQQQQHPIHLTPQQQKQMMAYQRGSPSESHQHHQNQKLQVNTLKNDYRNLVDKMKGENQQFIIGGVGAGQQSAQRQQQQPYNHDQRLSAMKQVAEQKRKVLNPNELSPEQLAYEIQQRKIAMANAHASQSSVQLLDQFARQSDCIPKNKQPSQSQKEHYKQQPMQSQKVSIQRPELLVNNRGEAIRSNRTNSTRMEVKKLPAMVLTDNGSGQKDEADATPKRHIKHVQQASEIKQVAKSANEMIQSLNAQSNMQMNKGIHTPNPTKNIQNLKMASAVQRQQHAQQPQVYKFPGIFQHNVIDKSVQNSYARNIPMPINGARQPQQYSNMVGNQHKTFDQSTTASSQPQAKQSVDQQQIGVILSTAQEKAMIDALAGSNKQKRIPIPGGSFRASKDDLRTGAIVAPTVFATQAPNSKAPNSPDKLTSLNRNGSRAKVGQVSYSGARNNYEKHLVHSANRREYADNKQQRGFPGHEQKHDRIGAGSPRSKRQSLPADKQVVIERRVSGSGNRHNQTFSNGFGEQMLIKADKGKTDIIKNNQGQVFNQASAQFWLKPPDPDVKQQVPHRGLHPANRIQKQ